MSRWHSSSNASVFERIVAKVKKDDVTGCWLFNGSTSANGYGLIFRYEVDEALKRRRPRTVYVHRFMAEHAHGPAPDGAVVRHACDNRRCCNPDHLSYGTQSQNMADAVRRGRFTRGRQHMHAKLTDEAAREIYLWTGPMVVMARKFDVAITTVSGIRNGYAWKHATEGLVRQVRRPVLTADIVRDIYSAGGTNKTIAAQFGLSESVVCRIRGRKTWTEVTAGLSPGGKPALIAPEVVRDVFVASGSASEIARAFSLSISTVGKIRRRKIYEEVTLDLVRGDLGGSCLPAALVREVFLARGSISAICRRYLVSRHTARAIRERLVRRDVTDGLERVVPIVELPALDLFSRAAECYSEQLELFDGAGSST